MPAIPTQHLEPLAPLVGRWRTSGAVFDEHGNTQTHLAGTDVYDWLPGGNWIAHDVDVTMGGQRVLVHELIGGVHPAGGWQMHAFDASDSPGVMRLSLEEPDLLLLRGDGVRSWLRIRAEEGNMTALWEREVGNTWLTWMEVRFQRS
jgi:hypothetical protein